MKLQYKVPLLVVGILAVLGLATGAVMVYVQRATSEDEFRQMAEGTAAIVRGALEHEMLQGTNQARVQDAMERLKVKPLINDVTVASNEGKVFASARKEEVGTYRIDDADFMEVLRTGKTKIRKEMRYGNEEYRVITPILNEPECYGCHGSLRPIRGIIEVSLETSFLDDVQRRQLLIIAIVGGLSFLAVGGAVTLTLRGAIFRQLGSLAAISKRLSEGDYSARAEQRRGDEVGLLAHTLNEMAEKVETHTRQLGRWNQELQETVDQRTQEISALNEVIATASRSLDLDTILQESLDRVVTIMGAEAGAICVTSGRGAARAFVHRRTSREQAEALLDNCPAAALLGGWEGQDGEKGWNDELFPPALQESNLRRQACVLVSAKGRPLGHLCLLDRRPGGFSESEMQLLNAMADAIGVGVENAQVAKRLREANEELNLLLSRAARGGFDVMFENPHLARCWEIKGCLEETCPSYKSENLRCWQVSGSFRRGEPTCKYASVSGGCQACDVFQMSCQRDEITAIGEGFNNMMLLLKLEAQTMEEMRGQFLDKLITAQEDERKRIARELHDQTSQSLTSLILGLKALEESHEMTKVREGSVDLQNLTLQALDEVRRLSVELRPAALDELGLLAALRTYFRELSQRTKLNIDFQSHGMKSRPSAVVETALYRIIQEAITNVLKHAEAKNVTVTLDRVDGYIVGMVHDDGKGFELGRLPTAAAWGKGLGLLGMRERAVLLRGDLSVESGAGGTTVRVTIPITVGGDGDVQGQGDTGG